MTPLFVFKYKRIISEDCKDTSELQNAKLYWPVSECWAVVETGEWRVSSFPHNVLPVHWRGKLLQNESSFGPAGLPDEHFSELCHVQSDKILEQCGLCGGGGQDSLQVLETLKTFSSLKAY